MSTNNIGVLLTNIGSPDAPTPQSVRQYLKKFLSDSRVVELPPFIWLPILYGVILTLRPTKSAKLYQKIWTQEGSPLLVISEKIAKKLENECDLPVVLGMHYGKPTIESALEKLQHSGVEKILILPMYPQYSATTTASTFDQVTELLKKWRKIPDIRTINHYANDPNYIHALCETIQKHPVNHLLFSYHGIPKRFIEKGDPYYEQCLSTTHSVVDKLKLTPDQWTLSFQSRLGLAEWLKPYTDQILQELPKQGITNIHVICPGFSVDCLETLEEISIRGKEQFMEAGGKSFEYIPALNDSELQIAMLQNLIQKNIQSW